MWYVFVKQLACPKVFPYFVWKLLIVPFVIFQTQGINLLVVGAAIKINIIPVDVFSLLNTLQIVGLALGNILNIIYILIIVIGSLMTLSAIMGMCGAFCESKCCITIVGHSEYSHSVEKSNTLSVPLWKIPIVIVHTDVWFFF